MVKIYGSSDDLVCLDNSNYAEDEICCYDVAGVWLFLDDDTVLLPTPMASGASASSRKVQCRISISFAPEQTKMTTAMYS